MSGVRVLMKDVASAAGVSKTTVCLALKDHPKISESQRKRVKEIARKMGYTVSPVTSLFIAQKKRESAPKIMGTFALVGTEPLLSDWKKNMFNRMTAHYCQDYSRKVGYAMDYFYAGTSEKEYVQLKRILYNRGIQCVILFSTNPNFDILNTDWRGFHVVNLLGRPRYANVHSIVANHFQDLRNVYKILRRRGYKRIGFWSSRALSGNLQNRWLSSYLMENFNEGLINDIQVGMFDDFIDEKVRNWVDTNKLDCVITTFNSPGVENLEVSFGRKIPDEIGYCSLDLLPDTTDVSGLFQQREEIVKMAISILYSFLTHGHWYNVHACSSIQVESLWHEGKTLRTDSSI